MPKPAKNYQVLITPLLGTFLLVEGHARRVRSCLLTLREAIVWANDVTYNQAERIGLVQILREMKGTALSPETLSQRETQEVAKQCLKLKPEKERKKRAK
jgi:hypothetical protein